MDGFDRFVADLASCDIGRTFNLFRDEISAATTPRAERLDVVRISSTTSMRAPAPRSSPSARLRAFEACAGRGSRSRASEHSTPGVSRIRGARYDPRDGPEPSATIVHRVLGEARSRGARAPVERGSDASAQPDNLLSNRRPERGGDRGREAISHAGCWSSVQPPKVVAIGRVAESVLDVDSRQRTVPYVRHPANAGAAEFADGMRELLAFDFTRVGRVAAAGSSRDRNLR